MNLINILKKFDKKFGEFEISRILEYKVGEIQKKYESNDIKSFISKSITELLEELRIKSIRPTDKRVENPTWNNGWNECAKETNQKIDKLKSGKNKTKAND